MKKRLLASVVAVAALATFGLAACSKDSTGSNKKPSGSGGDKDNDTGVYTVVFNANGGDFVGSPTTSVQTSNKKLSALQIIASDKVRRDGYEFKGWYTVSANTGGDQVTISYEFNGNATVWARWGAESGEEGTTYTITFDANGGSWDDEDTTKDVDTDSSGKVTAPEDPEWAGHEFLGWYDAEEDGEEVDSDYEFTEDSTVYAYWDTLEVELAENQVGLRFTDDTYVILDGSNWEEYSKLNKIYVWNSDGQVIDNNLTWGQYYDCSCAMDEVQGIKFEYNGVGEQGEFWDNWTDDLKPGTSQTYEQHEPSSATYDALENGAVYTVGWRTFEKQ